MAKITATKTVTLHFSFAQELAFIASEQARIASARTASPKASIANAIDAEYEQWKREMGLDRPMTREQYVQMFNPCGVC